MKIAIIGKMCSGKSTIKRKQFKIMIHNMKKFLFGQKVKDLAKELFNMIGKDEKIINKFRK